MVDREGGLDPVGGLGAMVEEPARIVGQHIEAVVAGGHRARELADRVQRGQVADQFVDLGRGGRTHGFGGGGQLFGIAADQDQAVPRGGELSRGGQPDPRRGPRDQHGLHARPACHSHGPLSRRTAAAREQGVAWPNRLCHKVTTRTVEAWSRYWSPVPPGA